MLWASCPDQSWVSNPLLTRVGVRLEGPGGCRPPAVTEPVLALPNQGGRVVLRNPLLWHFCTFLSDVCRLCTGAQQPPSLREKAEGLQAFAMFDSLF